jgi:hypothetical protein
VVGVPRLVAGGWVAGWVAGWLVGWLVGGWSASFGGRWVGGWVGGWVVGWVAGGWLECLVWGWWVVGVPRLVAGGWVAGWVAGGWLRDGVGRRASWKKRGADFQLDAYPFTNGGD